ncbi:hypothetical protein [Defluviitalea raffinosedens]|nr:hypothetical protein [Defluviitalea raffinosedens]
MRIIEIKDRDTNTSIKVKPWFKENLNLKKEITSFSPSLLPEEVF